MLIIHELPLLQLTPGSVHTQCMLCAICKLYAVSKLHCKLQTNFETGIWFQNCAVQMQNFSMNRGEITCIDDECRKHKHRLSATAFWSVLQRILCQSKQLKWPRKRRDRRLCACSSDPCSSELQFTVQALGKKAWVLAHQLFSSWPKRCALPSSQRKKQVGGVFLCNFKNVQKWLHNFEMGL